MPSQTKSILKLKRLFVDLNLQGAVETVRRLTGKGQIRQGYEILCLALGPRRFSPVEYYTEGLWRTDLSAEMRASIISEKQSKEINRQLSPIDGDSLRGLLTDKLLTALTLRGAGFPVLAPRAIFGKVLRVPGVESLASEKEIASFLRREGTLPIFGKPLHASLAIGAASYMSLADNGESIILGDRRRVNLAALTAEIAGNFARGYVFEPVIRQHPDVERVTGPAVGGLRIVTLRTADDVEVLYTLHRLPAVGAMMDATSGANPYTTAHIDSETGRVIRAQAMDSMEADGLVASLVTGVRFDNVVLPFMKECHSLVLDVHRLLVRPGLLGFDLALTPDGPLITEVNSNPYHTSYQHAAYRGFLNPDFRPKIEAAIAAVRAESRKP